MEIINAIQTTNEIGDLVVIDEFEIVFSLFTPIYGFYDFDLNLKSTTTALSQTILKDSPVFYYASSTTLAIYSYKDGSTQGE